MATIEDLQEDLSNLKPILEVYSGLLTDFKKDLSFNNKTLSHVNQEQASLLSYYDQIRVELESLMDYMELRVKEMKVKAMKKIFDNSQKSYGERILEKMAEDDPKYIDIYKKYLICKELFMKAESIVNSFEQRGYSINNITKLRLALIEDTIIYD